MKRILAVTILVLAAAIWLAGHDTWLVPARYRVVPGEPVEVAFNTSMEFPTSEAAADPSRIARFVVWNADGGTRPVTGHGVRDKSLVATVTPGKGLMMVGAVTRHRLIELEGPVFTEYISEEGLEHVVQARAEKDETDKMGRERYSKVAKAVLCEAGETEPAYDQIPTFEFDVEILPLTNPCTIAAGEDFVVLVMFEGAPLPGVVVATGTEGTHGHEYASQVRTDADGRATVRFPHSGAWFVRTLHMIPNRDFDDADWQSWFSTVTLDVIPPRE